MLVLTRRPGERILVGDNIYVTLLRIDRNRVRIGIEAPMGTKILREELVERNGNGEERTQADGGR